MKFLKDYWFLIVFILGLTGGAYTLRAEQTNTKEEVKEVKEEVKETDKKITENEKVDVEQTITLKYIQQSLEKLNDKIDRGKEDK